MKNPVYLMHPRSFAIAAFFIIIAALMVALVLINPVFPALPSDSIRVSPSFGSRYMVPIYEGSFGPNGSIDHYRDPHDPFPDTTNPADIPTEAEAPLIAESVMARFGGVPKDATLTDVHMSTYTVHKLTNKTGEPLIKIINESVVVQYERTTVNGVPFLGRDFIEFTLKSNKTFKFIWAQWRTHKPAGSACIISPREATERLKEGKYVRVPPSHYLVNVTRLELAYYYGNYTWYNIGILEDVPVLPVEPVWVFFGNDNMGETRSILVPARDLKNQEAVSCNRDTITDPADLRFVLEQPAVIDTAGMTSIDTAKQNVKKFLDQPEADVRYNGTIIGNTGSNKEYGVRRFVYYEFLVGSITIRVDKLTGNIVSADYSRMYPNAVNFTIAQEEAKAIATEYAGRKYSDYNNSNIDDVKSQTLTAGRTFKTNVYRFVWEGFVDLDDSYYLSIWVHPENGKILGYLDEGRCINDMRTGFYQETRIP